MRYRLFFNGTEITDNALGYRVGQSDDGERIVYHIDFPDGGFLKWSGPAASFYDRESGDVNLYLGSELPESEPRGW